MNEDKIRAEEALGVWLENPNHFDFGHRQSFKDGYIAAMDSPTVQELKRKLEILNRKIIYYKSISSGFEQHAIDELVANEYDIAIEKEKK